MVNDKLFSATDLGQHREKGNLWLAIHGFVYDVSEFMEDHPGGADALLDQSGIDATNAFEDVGHSDDARTTMEAFKIGKADNLPLDARTSSAEFMKLEQSTCTTYPAVLVLAVLLPILLWYAMR
ncbi:hypothetical protein N7490_008268 [Penicillium lividum]|nr:hypothetical protein N7490_008268 [Penicillium lividum]